MLPNASRSWLLRRVVATSPLATPALRAAWAATQVAVWLLPAVNHPPRRWDHLGGEEETTRLSLCSTLGTRAYRAAGYLAIES